MFESIALLAELIVPLIALFVVLEALSLALPEALGRWRTRFSPSVTDDLGWTKRAEALIAEGEASLDGRPLHTAATPVFMNNRPIRQAA